MNKNVESLENFFKKAKLPDQVQLNVCEKITDIPKFIETHLTIIKKQSGKRAYLPYYERLVRLKNKLENIS